MSSSRILIQVVPFCLLGLLFSGIGYSYWPPPSTHIWTIIHVLLILLVFVSLFALKKVMTWNVVLLLTLAFLIGGFARRTPSSEHGDPLWWIALGAAASSILMCFYTSRIIRQQSREFAFGLWLLTWIYIVGWLGLNLLDVDPTLALLWASFGLLLFNGIGVAWFLKVRNTSEKIPGSALGIDLYLIAISMVFAIQFVLMRFFTS